MCVSILSVRAAGGRLLPGFLFLCVECLGCLKGQSLFSDHSQQKQLLCKHTSREPRCPCPPVNHSYGTSKLSRPLNGLDPVSCPEGRCVAWHTLSWHCVGEGIFLCSVTLAGGGIGSCNGRAVVVLSFSNEYPSSVLFFLFW